MAMAMAVALNETVAVRATSSQTSATAGAVTARRRRGGTAPGRTGSCRSSPITRWVGALVIQRENACAQPTLVPACLTTITW